METRWLFTETPSTKIYFKRAYTVKVTSNFGGLLCDSHYKFWENGGKRLLSFNFFVEMVFAQVEVSVQYLWGYILLLENFYCKIVLIYLQIKTVTRENIAERKAFLIFVCHLWVEWFVLETLAQHWSPE